MNTKEGGRQSNFFETCSRCKTNNCCCLGTRPPINSKRRKIIEAYLKKKKIPIESPFVYEGYFFPRENPDGYCIFFENEAKRCLIHPAKPETCVAGPITFDINIGRKKIEWYIKRRKICPLAHFIYEDKNLLWNHFEAARRELLRLVADLDPEELVVILRKEEPDTFKIDEESLRTSILSKLTRSS